MPPRKDKLQPPERLSDEMREVWGDVVGRGRVAPSVDEEMLEAYCALVVRWRAAAAKLGEEGLVVADDRKGAIVHPALAVERQLAEQIREWSPLVNRPPSAARKRGPMYDATLASIRAAKLDQKAEFEGARTAVLTLAWLIDEAQRAGLEALQKASFVMIPSYMKGCADLKITPATLPESERKKEQGGGKVTKFEDHAARRRAAV